MVAAITATLPTPVVLHITQAALGTALTSRRLWSIGLRIAQVAIILIALAALLYAVGAPHYEGG